MNKTYHINLGGYPFTIDEDAYDQLNDYLKKIHRHFQDSEGCDEIISDIESRIAELFNEISDSQSIVSLEDVSKVIQIMGTPEEFGAIEDEDEGARMNYKTGRRLFRDKDNAVIGGVCSGMAAYFGIADPVWVRIVFAIILISGGIGVPLYFILWAIIPAAKTSADRLAMKGEDINVSNIAKMVEKEINQLSDTITEFGKGLGSKKKGKREKVGLGMHA